MKTEDDAATPWSTSPLFQVPEHESEKYPDGVTGLLVRGLPYEGSTTRFFSYYATPGSLSGDSSIDKNLPAIILVHGGGETASREWARFWAMRGYASLSLDLGGRGPDRSRLADGGPDDKGENKILHAAKPLADQWPFHAVADVIILNSLLRSFPEINRNKIAVAGASWGGFVTCLVAGIDHRIAAAVSVYGCGYIWEKSIWVDNKLFAALAEGDRQRWISLWDPSNYLPDVQCSVLFATGAKDFAYPLESWTKSVKLVPEQLRHLLVEPEMPHSGDFALTVLPGVHMFIDAVLNESSRYPRIGECQEIDGGVLARCKNLTSDSSAHLHYTCDGGSNLDRTWRTMPAKYNWHGEEIEASPPPARARIFFLTSSQAGYCMCSSLPVLR